MRRLATPTFAHGLVAGIAIGAALMFLVHDHEPDGVELVPADGVTAKEGPPPGLRSAGPLPDVYPGRERNGGSEDTPAESEKQTESAHTLNISVKVPEGKESIGGSIYILTAGSRGVNDTDAVPGTQVAGGRPVELSVDGPGPFDVYFTYGANVLVHQDVLVPAGPPTTLLFEPIVGAIRVRFESPLPADPAWVTTADVEVGAPLDRAVAPFPGRGERMSTRRASTLRAPVGTIDWIEQGQAFELHPRLWRRGKNDHAAGSVAHPELVAYCVPHIARAGDEVLLKIVPAATLEIALSPDRGTWPAGVARRLRVRIKHSRGTLWRMIDVKGHEAIEHATNASLRLPLPPGAVRVSVQGHEVMATEARTGTLVSGETLRLDLPLSLTWDLRTRTGPLRVDVAWPQGMGEDEELVIAGVVKGMESTDSLPAWGVMPQHHHPAPPMDVREAQQWLGVIASETHGLWTTGPVGVPSSGTLRLQPRPGGLLVLVPTKVRSERSPRLLMRRLNGAPIRHHGGNSFYARLLTETGLVIGPFLPGVHRFELWSGSTRVGIVEATVRAGRTTPLLLPR